MGNRESYNAKDLADIEDLKSLEAKAPNISIDDFQSMFNLVRDLNPSSIDYFYCRYSDAVCEFIFDECPNIVSYLLDQSRLHVVARTPKSFEKALFVFASSNIQSSYGAECLILNGARHCPEMALRHLDYFSTFLKDLDSVLFLTTLMNLPNNCPLIDQMLKKADKRKQAHPRHSRCYLSIRAPKRYKVKPTNLHHYDRILAYIEDNNDTFVINFELSGFHASLLRN